MNAVVPQAPILPPDHASRMQLADEVHARPPEALPTPCRATYVATLIEPADRARELAHVAALCRHFGVAPPADGDTHFSEQLGPIRFKWERHGEFSSLTLLVPGLSARPFSEPVARLLPAGWLRDLPGTTIVASLSGSQFRFAACRAYHQLVTTRIGELRESRLPGLQTISEFMTRRLAPAVATCAAASQRLRELSERVTQASALLSTRVDIARERQNQQLLVSMDRRARLQLRLQQTVEGLSVAAIVYYVVGVLGYLAKAAKATGVPLNPDLAVGAAVPVTAVAVLWALRRARRALHERDSASSAPGRQQE